MLKQTRQQLIQQLWQTYHHHTPHIKQVRMALEQKGITSYPLDHFAIIDLPSKHSGIPTLKKLFEGLGFVEKGRGYLPEKQNDFLWLAEEDSENHLATDVLPQVVVADFRLEEMPPAIRTIIEKYAAKAQQPPSFKPETGLQPLLNYLSGRDWPLPSIKEFETVKAFNELLAWVLIFGRRPNHFTISAHLLPAFNCLEDFQTFIETEAGLALNNKGGNIKGDETTGIAQGSTNGILQKIKLSDGTVELPTGFVEFVWRYPVKNAVQQPPMWNDYFTGFVANHANRVIESLVVNA